MASESFIPANANAIIANNTDVSQTDAGSINVGNSNSVIVEFKTYNLKEVDALRKKLSFANIYPPINLVDESSTGSCISVVLKTSLFEMMKHSWRFDMKRCVEIVDVVAITKAVAGTTNFGEVDVEFTLEASFVIKDIPNKVKAKCYPTKCIWVETV